MTRRTRSAGPIEISSVLATTLVAIRSHLAISAPPEVVLEDLVAVEKHLGGTIPDDLLALLIATTQSIGSLSTLTQSVAAFYEGMEETGWRKRFEFAHVAFDDSYNPDEGPLCAALGHREATIAFWFLRKGEAWAPTFLVPGEPSVVSYCRWKYPSVDFAAPIDPARLAAFQPGIVVPTEPQPRRVRHPKFGEGIVLRAIAPDKLEVDFGAHGVRKLLASAVEEI